MKQHIEHLVEIFKGQHIQDIKSILRSEYNAKVKQDGNLFIVTYDLIKTKLDRLGALALRGTIFELEDDVFKGKVICLPFYKFFNRKETLSFKGKNEDIYSINEKVDGSLIRLYYYGDKWNVASNNNIDAYKCFMGGERTLGDIFDTAVKNYNNFDFNKLDKTKIYCLELVSPENKVVLEYDKHELYHLLTRCMNTLDECEIDIGIPKPQNYKYSFEKMLEVLKNIKKQEGFVVKYKCGGRIKVKSDWYTTYHILGAKNIHSDPKLKMKNILNAIVDSYDDDLLGKHPEFQADVDALKNKIKQFEINCLKFMTEYKIETPVSNEKKIELFRSGAIKSIKDKIQQKAISLIITNRIKEPMEILKNNKQIFL